MGDTHVRRNGSEGKKNKPKGNQGNSFDTQRGVSAKFESRREKGKKSGIKKKTLTKGYTGEDHQTVGCFKDRR